MKNQDKGLQMFYATLKNNDYKSAFKYLDIILNFDKANLYIYLLSFLTEVPLKYHKHIEDFKIKYADINEGNNVQSKLEISILKQHFLYAEKLLNKLDANSVEFNIIRELLKRAIKIQMTSKNNVLNLVKSKRYEEIVCFLKSKLKQHDLRKIEIYILKLANEILRIQNTLKIPEQLDLKERKLFDAINTNNFSVALELSIENNIINNVNENDSALELLLTDLQELICILDPKENRSKKDIKYFVQDRIDKEKIFLDKKRSELLKNKAIILLDEMPRERAKRLNKIANKYSDISSFIIGDDDKSQVVLRYNPYLDDPVSVQNLITKGNLAYKEGNYDYCIECYLQLLRFGTPSILVYVKLGSAYMRKYDKEKAIEYFSIATHLSKEENGEFDFTELIENLKCSIRKPKFEMQISDFTNDDKYYGIENIDEITNYIMTSNLDVESACEKLGMNIEQIDIIRLIYAREYFSHGYNAKGEEFLKVVEKRKNKSLFVKKILDEIRKNKKIYSNRPSENSWQLKLTLKPRSCNSNN